LKYGIKNVIAVGGTNIPKTVSNLAKEKISTVFVDGDRGGELILREIIQVADIDFVARAPQTREVEEIPQKLIMKALKNKIPKEQFMDMYNIKIDEKKEDTEDDKQTSQQQKNNKKESSSQQEKKQQKKDKEDEKIMTSKQKDYEKILNDISGSLKAVLFDEKGNEIKKIPVRELTDEIKKRNNISTVVFDGIITQRLLDIANNKNVKEIVGIKTGNVVKMPKSVKILTKNDFQ
jgi:DNA primase